MAARKKPIKKQEKPLRELLNTEIVQRLYRENFFKKDGSFGESLPRALGIAQTESLLRKVIDSIAMPHGWTRDLVEKRYSLQNREISGELVYSTDITSTGLPLRVFFDRTNLITERTLKYLVESNGLVTEIKLKEDVPLK